MSETLSSQLDPFADGKRVLRALLVEDSESDVTLLLRHLGGDYDVKSLTVCDAAAMRSALAHQAWDVVLCDYYLPSFGFNEAVKVLRENDPILPCIVVSGSVGEDIAVDAMKNGAHDYIMKNNLTRLAPAIDREIRQAEARRDRARSAQKTAWLAAVVDSMTEAVIGTDYTGMITSWNTGAERLYGHTEAEAVGKPIELIVPPELHAEIRQMLDDVQRGGQVAEFETTVRRRRDSSAVHVSSVISVVKDENGHVIGAAILVVDITERKKAEEENSRMIRELSETLAQVRTLQGLLPICASCKKIRDEQGKWNSLESYITGHSQAQFSHSICPACATRLYPDFVNPPGAA